MLLVYSSERLNQVVGQHWKAFAGAPYFDKNGIFISALLSAPLMLDMLAILVRSKAPVLQVVCLMSVLVLRLFPWCIGLLPAQLEQDAGANEEAGAQAQS